MVVGALDGTVLVENVGATVGETLGMAVGAIDGTVLGENVGATVGETLGMAVGAEMKQKIDHNEKSNIIATGRFLRIAQGQNSRKPVLDL